MAEAPDYVDVRFVRPFGPHPVGSVRTFTAGQAHSLCDVYLVAERVEEQSEERVVERTVDDPDTGDVLEPDDDDETVDLDPPDDPPKRKRGRPRKVVDPQEQA